MASEMLVVFGEILVPTPEMMVILGETLVGSLFLGTVWEEVVVVYVQLSLVVCILLLLVEDCLS